jgi:hypothetical protein
VPFRGVEFKFRELNDVKIPTKPGVKKWMHTTGFEPGKVCSMSGKPETCLLWGKQYSIVELGNRRVKSGKALWTGKHHL